MALLKIQRNVSGINQQTSIYLSLTCSENIHHECPCRHIGTFSSSSATKSLNGNSKLLKRSSAGSTNSGDHKSNYEKLKEKISFQTFGVNIPIQISEMNKYLTGAFSSRSLNSDYDQDNLSKNNNDININNSSKSDRCDESDPYSLEKTITKMNQSIESYYDTTYVQDGASLPKSDKSNTLTSQVPNQDELEGKEAEMFDDDMANVPVRRKFFFSGLNADSEAKLKRQKAQVRRAEKISRLSLESRTRALTQGARSAFSLMSRVTRLEELCDHLVAHPECVWEASDENILPILLRLSTSPDKNVRGMANQCLCLLGYAKPLQSPGLRILSIDGGGTRGIVAIEFLKSLEKQTGKRVYELFDYVCGVSTGSLLLAMVCLYKIPLDQCADLYKKFSVKTFTRNKVVGTTKLVWNHGFYDSSIWEDILRREMGTTPLIEFCRDQDVPKFCAVSAKVSSTGMVNYLFRNYNLPPGVTSHFQGHCKHKIWEVIRASSAAPGYFKPFTLGRDVHEDGGILSNNPTSLAIHESRLLWHQEKFHCVVSLGTGRFQTKTAMPKLSLKRKLSSIVDSACDTESVHYTLQDLLPLKTYYRFNPYLSEEFFLDEIRIDKLEQMQQDARLYTRRNSHKLETLAERLTQKRTKKQVVVDWLKETVNNL